MRAQPTIWYPSYGYHGRRGLIGGYHTNLPVAGWLVEVEVIAAWPDR